MNATKKCGYKEKLKIVPGKKTAPGFIGYFPEKDHHRIGRKVAFFIDSIEVLSLREYFSQLTTPKVIPNEEFQTMSDKKTVFDRSCE